MSDESDLKYDLGRLIAYCDRDTENTLEATLAQLPPLVRDFALGRCAFAWVGDEGPAQVLPPLDRWLVLLSDDQPGATMAHEIAHAWLGHVDGVGGAQYEEQERRTRELVRSWGFVGIGAEPST